MTPLKIFQSFDRLGDSGKSGVWQYEIIEIFQILQTHGVLPLGVRIMQILQVMEMLQKIPRLQRLQMIQMLMMYLFFHSPKEILLFELEPHTTFYFFSQCFCDYRTTYNITF